VSLPPFLMNVARAFGAALLLMAGVPIVAGAAPPASQVTARAAAPGADPAPAPPAPAEVTGPPADAFAAAEVPVAAKKTLNRLRHLKALLQPRREVARIEEGLPPVARYLEQLQSLPSATRPEDLPPRDLEDAVVRWRRHEAELDVWQQTLERRAQELETAATELRATHAAWKDTRAQAVAAGSPAVLLEQVDGVLGAAADVYAQLTKHFDRIVTIQGRVGELVDLIDGVMVRLDEVRHEQVRQLYKAESPPLWTAVRRARPGAALSDQVRQTRIKLRAAAGEFLEAYGKRMPWHAVAFLLLVGVLAGLGRATRRLQGDDPGMVTTLAAARHILDRPISSGFMLALFLARPIYPLAPPPIIHGLMVAALLPVLRLLPRLVWPEMRAPLYGLAVLVGLRELSMVAAEGTVLHRLLLLVVAVGGIAGAAHVAAPWSRSAARAAGTIWRTVIAGGRLAIVLLLAAVLANLTGRVWLADRLAGATVLSVYAALLFFAGVMVLDGVSVILLRQAGARALASVRNNEAILRRRVRWVFDIAATTWWLFAALGAFQIREPVMMALQAVAAAPLGIGSLNVSVGDLMTFGVAIAIAFLLSRFVRFILVEDILPRLALEPGVRPMVLMLLHYVIVGLGAIFGIAAAGFPVDRLTLLISAFGVGIGFGLQSLVNNFVSGLSLIFERPIRVGDQVQVGTLLGQVESIGIRATVLRTAQGAEVIVPNADLITKEVTNWTLSDRLRRLEITVGVAYGTDPQRVIDLLSTVARGHADVLAQPAPVVLFQRFGESSLDFALRFWTVNDDRWLGVESEIRVAVCRALDAAGIAIPFPQRDLHLVSVDPAARAALSGPAPDSGRPGAD